MARFLLFAAASIAISFATPEKRQILVSPGFAAPAVATATASPIYSIESAAPAFATVAAAPSLYSTASAYNYGLPYYDGLGYGGLGYAGGGNAGLGYAGLGYNTLPSYGYSSLSSYPWASSAAVGYPYVNSAATVTSAPLIATADTTDTRIAIVNRH